MESRRDGSYGGPGSSDADSFAGGTPTPTMLREAGGAVDPAAVVAPTTSMRVVMGSGAAARAASAQASGPAPVPGQRARSRFSGEEDTAVLPPLRETLRSRKPDALSTRPVPQGEDPPASPLRRGGVQAGVVLLPLRLFLGLAFMFEGLRKLYDPSFLDATVPDSLAHRIDVLRDGSFFPPVMDLAGEFAITVGLLFAFGQVVCGFGAMIGLWTRFMGLMGMLLSLGVLIAVGSSSSPYHAPYIVFLAAWSPLALAGAPMYSADAWLSLRDWRGPVTQPVRARRRKLGYGSLLACAGVGAVLLAGAMFGNSSKEDQVPPDTGVQESAVQLPSSPGPAVAPAASPGASVSASPSASSPSRGPASPQASSAPRQGTSSRPSAAAPTPQRRAPAGGGGTTSGGSSGGGGSSGQQPARSGQTPLGGLLGS